MTDLIERLRRAKGSDGLRRVLLGGKNAEMTCLEAAEEIERLREALEPFANHPHFSDTAMGRRAREVLPASNKERSDG